MRIVGAFLASILVCPAGLGEEDRKAEYVHAVTRGAGLLPWQDKGPTKAEISFRQKMEARKDAMLAGRGGPFPPALVDEELLARAKRNIDGTEWGKAWLASHKNLADAILEQPEDFVESMVPELTPSTSMKATSCCA